MLLTSSPHVLENFGPSGVHRSNSSPQQDKVREQKLKTRQRQHRAEPKKSNQLRCKSHQLRAGLAVGVAKTTQGKPETTQGKPPKANHPIKKRSPVLKPPASPRCLRDFSSASAGRNQSFESDPCLFCEPSHTKEKSRPCHIMTLVWEQNKFVHCWISGNIPLKKVIGKEFQ